MSNSLIRNAVRLTATSLVVLAGVAVMDQASAAAKPPTCGGAAWAAPGTWGPTSRSNCSVVGSPGFREFYIWHVNPGSNANVCVQAWGYSSGKGRWYSLGCGSGGNGAVPWGNVLGQPKFRARSTTVPLGATVVWQH
jgi:hypothetical protein